MDRARVARRRVFDIQPGVKPMSRFVGLTEWRLSGARAVQRTMLTSQARPLEPPVSQRLEFSYGRFRCPGGEALPQSWAWPLRGKPSPMREQHDVGAGVYVRWGIGALGAGTVRGAGESG
jgi:hypothetical protein